MPTKFTLKDVRLFLEQNDINHECELLSTEYINNQTPLKFRCNVCGKEFERDFNHIQRKRFRCPDCGISAGAKKLVYSKKDVEKDIWEKRKYKMLGKYVNATTPFLVECDKGHTFNLIYSQFLEGRSGCSKCAYINQSGENHWNWQGGISTINDYFRTCLTSWKKSCLAVANYTCDITNRKDHLVVHHFRNFSDIVYEAFKDLGIEYKPNILDYTIEEKQKIQDYILSQHTLDSGVVLTEEIHKKFHQKYGFHNNTKKQYEQFKKEILEKGANL